MKVVHGTHDAHNGGAGRAAHRIYLAAAMAGVESSMVSPMGKIRWNERAERRLSVWQGSAPGHFRSAGIFPGESSRLMRNLKPDVIHLHWIGRGFMSIRQVGRIRTPLVWTLHDMWPFCGSEHYTGSDPESGWKHGYSRTLSGDDWDLWSWLSWKLKSHSWRSDIIFVSPSKWMADLKASSALLPESPVVVIPNPVPVDIFRDMDKRAARQAWDIEQDSPVIGFVADEGAANPMKGHEHLMEAMTHVWSRHPNARLLMVGKNSVALPQHLGRVISTGQLRDDHRLAMAYAACDVVCVPSLLDNAPQTVTEASASARPVVAYAAGGIPELIEPGSTGLLCRIGDRRELAAALCQLLDVPDEARTMGAHGRARALKAWTPAVVGRAYEQVYADVLANQQR